MLSVLQASAEAGQTCTCSAETKLHLAPYHAKQKKHLPQSKEESSYLALLLGAGQAWSSSCGPCRALPLDDKLDAVAGFQDLPELGDSKAVGPAEGDAFRQPHHKQLLWVHQELGVGHLDRLRDANGLGCRDTAAVGPSRSRGHEPRFPPPMSAWGGRSPFQT